MTRRHRRGASPVDDQDVSPLRQARKDHSGATLEQVCADLDEHAPNGSSGVHPSMLSSWERGLHITSAKYRTLLCAYYQQPEATLFAHQDLAVDADSGTPRLVLSHQDLHHAMLAVTDTARRYLAVTGSRSRNTGHLEAIESALARRPDLVHYRILFGRPRHRLLTDHLLRLLELRDPEDRSLGMKTLHIAIIETDIPEKFFIANEGNAVIPIPSLTSAEGFDSGVVLGVAGARLIDHARQLYAAGRRLETPHALEELGAT